VISVDESGLTLVKSRINGQNKTRRRFSYHDSRMSTFFFRSSFHEICVGRWAAVELPESMNKVMYALIETFESDSIACRACQCDGRCLSSIHVVAYRQRISMVTPTALPRGGGGVACSVNRLLLMSWVHVAVVWQRWSTV